jgi:hypothetical protein
MGQNSTKDELVREAKAVGWKVTEGPLPDLCPGHAWSSRTSERRKKVLGVLDRSNVEWEERSDYSGRGMDGRISVFAVVVDRPDSQSVYKALTGLGLSCDSMGKKSVYYSLAQGK